MLKYWGRQFVAVSRLLGSAERRSSAWALALVASLALERPVAADTDVFGFGDAPGTRLAAVRPNSSRSSFQVRPASNRSPQSGPGRVDTYGSFRARRDAAFVSDDVSAGTAVDTSGLVGPDRVGPRLVAAADDLDNAYAYSHSLAGRGASKRLFHGRFPHL